MRRFDRFAIAGYWPAARVEEALLILDFVDRYQAVAYALEKIRPLLADLHFQRYWGDYAL